MKKLLLISITSILFFACQKVKSADPIGCDDAAVCKQKGYGLQSSLALCADFVNSACDKAAECSDNFDIKNCHARGLPVCLQAQKANAEKVYNNCLPALGQLDCQLVLVGEFPDECKDVFE